MITLKWLAPVLIGLAVAGCSDSSNRSGTLSTDFTAFVKQQISNTRDDRQAIDLRNVAFRLNDQDNEQAYDDLF